MTYEEMLEGQQITEQRIFNGLKQLNEKFKEINVRETIVISGGALSVLEGIREKTADIDICTELADSRYLHLIKMIGYENGMKEDWLNDESYYVTVKGLPTIKLYEFSNLDVHRLTDNAILISKIDAARSKDLADAIYFAKKLGFTSKEQIMDICRPYKILFTADEVTKSIAEQKEMEKIEIEAGNVEFVTDFDKLRDNLLKKIFRRGKFLEKVIEDERIKREQNKAYKEGVYEI